MGVSRDKREVRPLLLETRARGYHMPMPSTIRGTFELVPVLVEYVFVPRGVAKALPATDGPYWQSLQADLEITDIKDLQYLMHVKGEEEEFSHFELTG